jgi:UDP-2,4-diacetamido-2,4,6-trideoxy-beta-L-altropyranose hydrolase
MPRNRIVFRADGNAEIGMGHFVRSLALARMLAGHFSCTFATQAPSPSQRAALADAGIGCLELPGGQGAQEAFVAGLQGDEIVVLDGYGFDLPDQRRIMEKGCRLVCIDDDMRQQAYAADAVINHAPGVEASQYPSINPQARFCLGTDYALLRPEFAEMARHAPQYEPGESCFICFGGSDKYGLSLTALQAAADLDFIGTAHVVLGQAYRQRAELANLAEVLADTGLLQVHLHHDLDAPSLLGVMRQCQMAIVPASTILYEVMCIGMPIFSGYYIDNQKELYKGFQALGTLYGMGNFHNYTANMLAASIAQSGYGRWAAEQAERQHQAIDGRSPERFLELFQSLAQ